MRHPRYIAIAGQRDPFGTRRIVEERAAATGLRLIVKVDGLTVYCDTDAAFQSVSGDTCVILGAIRRKSGRMPDYTPTAAEASAVVSSAGDVLIDECWGDYLALLASSGGAVQVLRPPFGDLACVHAGMDGLRILTSDRRLLAACTREPATPHWPMIANHLFTVGLRQPQSCLTGIEELLWGTRLVVDAAGARLERCWTPWRFAATREGESVGALCDMLRSAAIDSVGAAVRSLDHVAVMLSGGLDSSILAACVAASDTRLTCITLTSGDAVGDERAYAGVVAKALRVPLLDADHVLAEVDVARSQAAWLVRPVARSFAQAAHAAKQRVAQQSMAEAILDGGGGDNIFCSLQSVTPIADRLLRGHFGRDMLTTAASVAQMTETALPRVFGLAIRRVLRSPRYRWKLDDRFLTPSAIDRAGAPDHPWLDAPASALPGSAAHIAMIAIVEALLETSDTGLPERAALMNQPLVEACLSIPSWLWFEAGNNRAIARRAFSDILPREIAWRRSKGTPDGFVARVFEANRAALRTLLCDGRLAEEGLLDRDAIARTIARPGPVKGHDHIRLLRIADVEAWVRSL